MENLTFTMNEIEAKRYKDILAKLTYEEYLTHEIIFSTTSGIGQNVVISYETKSSKIFNKHKKMNVDITHYDCW